jgi:hypothetical protein
MLATGIDHSKAPIPNKTFAVHSRPLHEDQTKKKKKNEGCIRILGEE